ncbi:hypothetical protein ABZV80_42800 [Streptomyces sp. NPDC005132]|uniref:hypothetical protein n=1 Tax=Streptomyces sp. NPDC005132 TaxID=3154294 RepID=UPI0033A63FBE
MTKRLSIALASTVLAGGALLGSGGSASAATASVPVQHTQHVSATSMAGSERVGRYSDHEAQAASGYGISAARWYQDQVEEATSSHVVTPARWYEDQVEWSLDHS